MSNYVRVERVGSYGHDVNKELINQGLYCIPVSNYNPKIMDEDVVWVNVDIKGVIIPPMSRYHLIIGYDENNESQMWYYNGAQRVFKRIWQDGCMGASYKTKTNILEYLIEDAYIDEDDAKNIARRFIRM